MNQYINTMLEDEPGGDGIPEDASGGGVYDDLIKKHIETRRKKLSAMADCFRASNKCAVDVLDCLDKHGNDIRNVASGSSTSLAERTPIGSQPPEPEAQYAHHVQTVVNQTAPTGGTSTEDLLAERPDVNTPWHVDGRGIVYMDISRVVETSGEQQEDVSATDILAKVYHCIQKLHQYFRYYIMSYAGHPFTTIANADTHTSAAGYSNGGVKNDPIWENRTANRDNSGINMAPVEIESATDIDVDDVPANNNNTAIVMLRDAVSRTEAYNNVSGHPVDNMSREDQPMFQAHVQTPDALVNEAIEAGSASVSVEGGVRTPITRSKTKGASSPTDIKSYKRPLKNVLSAPLPIYAPAMFMYKKDAHLVRRFILNGSVLDKHGETTMVKYTSMMPQGLEIPKYWTASKLAGCFGQTSPPDEDMLDFIIASWKSPDLNMSDSSKPDGVIQYDAASKVKEMRMMIGKTDMSKARLVDSRSLMDEYLFWALFCPANEAKDDLPAELKSYAPKPK
ncbi:hypothetical protein ACQ4PT_019185 [Festuca glaucescens]